MAAKQCKHQFQGHKDGVTCMKCGLKMGVEEYLNYLNPKEEVQEETKEEVKEKPQRKPRTQKGAK